MVHKKDKVKISDFKQRYYIGFPWMCYGQKFNTILKTRLVGTGALLF